MAFFRDLKCVVDSVLDVANDGMSMLKLEMSELGRIARKGHLETQIRLAEDGIKRADLLRLPASERDERFRELLSACDELIELSEADEVEENIRRKAALMFEHNSISAKEKFRAIENSKRVVEASVFRLPIDEIQKRRLLLVEVEELGALAGKVADSSMLEWSRREKEDLLSRIADLERRRAVEELSLYTSGGYKRLLSKYDGRMHGVSKSWHENGFIESSASFRHGRLHGVCRRWSDDGKLMINLVFDQDLNEVRFECFISNEARFINGSLRDKTGTVELQMLNGVGLAKIYVKNGKSGKAGAFARLIFNPGFWRAVWGIISSESDRQIVNEMHHVLDGFDLFLSDLKLLEKC